MTCYIAVWKINVIHNIIVWKCYITCYIWFKSGAFPPSQCTCGRIWSKLKAKSVLFIYSSSGRPRALTPLERPPCQWLCPSMVLLGCLCHSLLKMNAQDEQQWREIQCKSNNCQLLFQTCSQFRSAVLHRCLSQFRNADQSLYLFFAWWILNNCKIEPSNEFCFGGYQAFATTPKSLILNKKKQLLLLMAQNLPSLKNFWAVKLSQ